MLKVPLSASALITALFAAVIAGGKASPFVFGGLSAIFALSLFYWRARFPWTKYCNDRVLIAFVVFCTYVGLSAFWSEAPRKALIAATYLGACAGVAVWLVRAVPLVNPIAQELFARDFLRGYAAGLCFLIFEVLTNQSINKFVANAFRGLFSHDGKFYVDVEGTIGHVEPGILNWSIVAVNLLAWPALLYTAAISIPEHRLRNQISLYCAVFSLVFLSVHATSKIALISGLITFILARRSRRLTFGILRLFLCVALFGALPFSLTVEHLRLHELQWLPSTARSRIVIWGFTAQQTLRSPIFGVGAETTRVHPISDPTTAVPDVSYPRSTSVHAHNVYLQTWYELGFVGALLLLVCGALVIKCGACLPPTTAPYAASTTAVALTTMATSFGMWQPWFIAIMTLSAVLVAFAAHLAAIRGLGMGLLSWDTLKIGEFLDKKAAYVAAALALTICGSTLVGYLSRYSGKDRDRVIQLLEEATTCRRESPLGCSGTADALARTLIMGEGRSAFTAWGRAEFGVYLYKRHLIFVRANCTPEDVHDDFAIHFLFRDPSVPDKPQTGSDWQRFRFSDFGYLTNGYCSALYPIAAVNVHHITTGQVIEGKGFTWRVDLDWAPSADNQ
jgi:O-antigen ligase